MDIRLTIRISTCFTDNCAMRIHAKTTAVISARKRAEILHAGFGGPKECANNKITRDSRSANDTLGTHRGRAATTRVVKRAKILNGVVLRKGEGAKIYGHCHNDGEAR